MCGGDGAAVGDLVAELAGRGSPARQPLGRRRRFRAGTPSAASACQQVAAVVPMVRVVMRFYAELNDFLPARLRQVSFEHAASEGASVKHVIEALGVPHTEVDLILVNGESVDFAYRVLDGDHISVYPVFESLDIGSLERVR